jgi:Tol biopolymer transport system component
VKLQLAWIAEGGSDVGVPKVVAKRRRNRASLLWALALIPALVVGAVLRDVMRGPATPEAVTRTHLMPPAGTRFEATGDDSGPPVISPDGSRVVFSAVGGGGGKRLWLRRLDSFDAQPIPGTDGASYPFWSPDGRSIAFFTPKTLKRVDLDQGSVITLVSDLDASRGGTWSRDNVIVFCKTFASPLYQVAATGGPVTAATSLDSTVATTHRFPCFLPDGRHFIYLSANHRDAAGASSGIYFASLDGGEPKRVITCRSNAVYSNGFVFFVQDSTLMAQAFNPDTGATRGDPRATREVVQIDRSTWRMSASVSNNGTLVYATGTGTGNNRLTLYDRSGTPLKQLTDFGNILNVDMSPDGRRVVYELQTLPLADLWVVDRITGTRSRVTTNPEDETLPLWSRDGRDVLYAGRRADGRYRIFSARADGTGSETLVLEDPTRDVWPLALSPDGRWLVYGLGVASGTQHGSIEVMPMGGGPGRTLVPESDGFNNTDLSPDGRWLAFSALVSGRLEVYVSPFRPADGAAPARWQVTARGGDRPRWRGDGAELYYTRPDGALMAVEADGSGADFRVGAEKQLFQVFQRIGTQTLCVSRDGQSFAINTLGGSSQDPIAVVLNWTPTLETR